MRLYKVLEKDMISPFQGFVFEDGKKYCCQDFDENPENACSNGFYATDIDGLIYTFTTSRDVWECEVGGKAVEIDQFKRRYEEFELIEKLSHDEVKRRAIEVEEQVGYRLSEALFPVNPLYIERTPEVSQEEIGWLKSWDTVRDTVWDTVWGSVRDTVWDTVWGSVRDTVWGSVCDTVCDTVRDTVWDTVRDTVWGYIGSLFLGIDKWKYIEHEFGIYPFQPVVNLWKAGLVPSFDGNKWRLHTGEKAQVVYEHE